ncbi:hypothetical protein D9M68_475870 [compost metagenome]
MQVVAVLVELFLQRLAPHGQPLPFHALLLQLAAQQLRLLLGLGAALLGVAQLAVGVFQGQARRLELFFHLHAPVEQLFQAQAQLFQRRGALLQIEAELLATLDQAHRLAVQTFQRLAGGFVLGAQRTDPHRQLVRMVLVLAGLLADAVEAFAQGVALGEHGFAALGVHRHGIQRFLQLHARFGELFLLQRALLGQFGQFLVQPAAAQHKLFDLGLLRGQLRLQFALLAAFLLDAPAQLLAALLGLALLVALAGQLLVDLAETHLQRLAILLQTLQFLAAGQHAAVGGVATAHAQEVPADPVAVAADQALALAQRGAPGQRVLQAFHRTHLAQPGRQVERRLHLVQQAARSSGDAASQFEQAQLALLQAGERQPGEIVQ